MKNNKWKKTLLNVIAIIVFYLLFSFSLFLGLQVNTTYGTIGVIAVTLLLIAYIFVFRKSK